MLSLFLNVIAPDDCIQCGIEGSTLCGWCRLDIEQLPSRCFKCHAQTTDFNTCKLCRRATGLNRVVVCHEYKDTSKSLVTALKFESKREAVKPIAETMNEQIPYLPNVQLITCVPTASQRVRQRGFDHMILIAKELGRLRGLPYSTLLRRKNNSRQVGSTRNERLKNAQSAYTTKPNAEISGKEILLIDDVVTTGATLSACVKELKRGGARRVHTAVFAYSK